MSISWSGVRVAEGAALEMRCAGNRTEGSNPSRSVFSSFFLVHQADLSVRKRVFPNNIRQLNFVIGLPGLPAARRVLGPRPKPKAGGTRESRIIASRSGPEDTETARTVLGTVRAEVSYSQPAVLIRAQAQR